MKKLIAVLGVLALLLSACAANEGNNAQPEDGKLLYSAWSNNNEQNAITDNSSEKVFKLFD